MRHVSICVLPRSVVGDTRHPIPAECDVVDRDEARAAVLELAATPDASELVTIALGDVHVQAVRLHPRPPSVDEGIPHLFVGFDRELPTLGPEQDAVGVVVPRKCEQHLAVRAREMRLPVRRAEEVERDDHVLVRSRPGKREIDVRRPDGARQLEHSQRSSEVTIGFLHDLDGSPFDRDPVPLTVGGHEAFGTTSKG